MPIIAIGQKTNAEEKFRTKKYQESTLEKYRVKIKQLGETISELKSAQRNSAATENVSHQILNSLSAHVAILDKHGTIIETNQAWKKFALSNGLQGVPDSININYLQICDTASGEFSEQACEAAAGIRNVLEGQKNYFSLDYQCHSPNKKRWFYMRVVRLIGSGKKCVVVVHENITQIKEIEVVLRLRKEELTSKAQKLEDTNTAFRILLKQREEDKSELEQNVLRNTRELILPYVDRAKINQSSCCCDHSSQQQVLLDIVENRIKEIVSPFLNRLSHLGLNLTPKELQIASFIREGNSNKEIARTLFLSIATIQFHRRNIRRKTGLINSKSNLRTYLLSLV